MNRTDAQIIDELANALGSATLLVATGPDELEVVDAATTQRWPLACTASELAQRARELEHSGREAGVGGPPGSGAASPGVALLSIHISEAIATAVPTAARLVLVDGGLDARP